MRSEAENINRQLVEKLQLDPDDATDVEIALAIEQTKQEIRESEEYSGEETEILDNKAWAIIMKNLRTLGTVLP